MVTLPDENIKTSNSEPSRAEIQGTTSPEDFTPVVAGDSIPDKLLCQPDD